jgi:PAP2 superfamily
MVVTGGDARSGRLALPRTQVGSFPDASWALLLQRCAEMADLTARTRGAVDALSRSARGGFVREAGLVAAAMVAYFGIRNGTVGGPEEAFKNADRILDFERWLHIAWEDSVQAWIVGSDFLVMLTNWVYIWGHWPVILGTAMLLYRFRRDSYYLLRNALFVSGAIGFFFFAVLPVAPPRLLDLGLVDTVTDQSNTYRAFQPPGLTNQYAAFPSLHVGWNIVVGIVLLMTTAHLAVRVFAVASPLAMAFAVVATANHFVVDVAAGLLVVLAGLAVALAIEGRHSGAATLGASGPAACLQSSRRAQPVRRRTPRGQQAGRARRRPALRRSAR